MGKLWYIPIWCLYIFCTPSKIAFVTSKSLKKPTQSFYYRWIYPILPWILNSQKIKKKYHKFCKVKITLQFVWQYPNQIWPIIYMWMRKSSELLEIILLFKFSSFCPFPSRRIFLIIRALKIYIYAPCIPKMNSHILRIKSHINHLYSIVKSQQNFKRKFIYKK